MEDITREENNNKTEVSSETLITSTNEVSTKEVTEVEDAKRTVKNSGLSWFLVPIISILCSVLSIFVYDRYFAQKIATFDLKGFIAEQRDLYIAGKLTDDQFKANLDNIEKIITSVPKRKVIIMGDAVIRNAEVIGKQNSKSDIKK